MTKTSNLREEMDVVAAFISNQNALNHIRANSIRELHEFCVLQSQQIADLTNKVERITTILEEVVKVTHGS